MYSFNAKKYNVMISILTAFKKFRDKAGRAQRIAIYSWKMLGIPVYAVMDNEVGVQAVLSESIEINALRGAKTGRDLGFATGAVLLNDLIRVGLKESKTLLLGVCCGDVILPMDFMKRMQDVVDDKGLEAFYYARKLDIKEGSYEGPSGYADALMTPVIKTDGVGFFTMSRFNLRKMSQEMPDIIFGRDSWLDWTIKWCFSNGVTAHDVTEQLGLRHIEHDHNHIILQEGVKSKSAEHNRSFLK